MIPAFSEAFVTVKLPKSGLFLLEHSDQLYERRGVSMANGIAEAQANTTFQVRVANFTGSSVLLKRGQVVGTAVPAPSVAYSVNVTDDGMQPETGQLIDLYTGEPIELDLSAEPDFRLHHTRENLV